MGRPQGFEEADLYPTPPIHAHLAGVPSSTAAQISGLGSRYFLATAGGATGRPQLYLTGDSSREYAAHVLTLDRSGARIVYPVSITEGRSDITEIPLDWSDIAFFTIVVSVVDELQIGASTLVTVDNLSAVGVLPPEARPRLELAPNYPNPFSASTTIAFALSASADVHLAVIDAAGRLVRTLAKRALPEGHHEIIWDGLDDRGARSSPGVYAVRLQSPGHIASRKIHLLR
jgi:hypothetical protein